MQACSGYHTPMPGVSPSTGYHMHTLEDLTSPILADNGSTLPLI
jgi:hypothetical protein